VVHAANGPRVQVVVDGTVQTRAVRTGLSADGFVEIVEGLRSGEEVVARAGSFLREGDVVRPVPAQASKTAGNERVR
jgi:HlyD family secretion protein